MPAGSQPPREDEQEQAREDLRLVERALAGDREARDDVIRKLGCVRRILASRNRQFGKPLTQAELEDLTQDVVVSVWRKLDTYSGLGAFEAWVWRFCFLDYMTALRAKRRQPRLALDLREDERPPEPAELVEPRLARFEGLYLALDQVGPPDADIIRAKHFEELTFEQIADLSGQNISTVKTRYYRGLGRLQTLLKSSGGQSSPGGQDPGGPEGHAPSEGTPSEGRHWESR